VFSPATVRAETLLRKPPDNKVCKPVPHCVQSVEAEQTALTSSQRAASN
jgi:hypothetical protein